MSNSPYGYFGQPSHQYPYGTPGAPLPPERNGLKKAGMWTTIGSILAGLLGFGLLMFSIFSVSESIGNQHRLSSDGIAQIAVPEASMALILGQPAGDAVSCSISGPSGSVPVTSYDGSVAPDPSGSQMPVGQAMLPEAGDYTFTCPSLDSGAVTLVPDIAGSGLAMLAGLALMGLAFVAFIAGIIMWVVGANRNKAPASQQSYGSYPPPPPPSGYASQ